MSPRRGGDEPTSLGDALAAVGRELGMSATGAVTALARRWPEVVGDDVAEHAHPSSVRDGVLTVVVDGPIWATQLRYLEAVILEHADPGGPFGARGIGEPPLIGTPPAIMAAIADAIGTTVNELPATPERVWRAIQEKTPGERPRDPGAAAHASA